MSAAVFAIDDSMWAASGVRACPRHCSSQSGASIANWVPQIESCCGGYTYPLSSLMWFNGPPVDNTQPYAVYPAISTKFHPMQVGAWQVNPSPTAQDFPIEKSFTAPPLPWSSPPQKSKVAVPFRICVSDSDLLQLATLPAETASTVAQPPSGQ